MRLGSRCGGGARVCMRWDGQGVCRGGRSESEWVGIGGSLTQTPIPHQLAIALYRFGHFGSRASIGAIAQWAGCSVGWNLG